ncbi:aminoglycoside phosphotransferase family protein [Tritonibacter mobilis]|uniref:aminoglycoside phosphotransferase family protein n=1 Tax=Tritonibacter mobilis TaxID=379347 RepID=UPI001CD9B98C|nr:aminoglycoside phosphotransferase family protein [Tritonibacter mobilis]MCA2009473.1 phosphotransferase [Tritonibacter mobilis]
MSLPPTELLHRFGLSAPELVAETTRAIVWRVRQQTGTQAALKYYPAGHMGNETSGLAYLERVEGAGAVRVFARSTDAVVMEWLQGPSLGELARTQGAEAADHRLAEVAARLFAAEVSADGLLSVAEIMAPLRDACFTALEAREAQNIAWACLDQMQRGAVESVALHGDLHHDNIIHTAQGLRAFDAKGLAGPRAYELANAFRHPRGCRAFAADAQVIRDRAITWGRVAGCGAQEQLNWAIAKLLLSMLWSGQEAPEERALLRQMLRVAEKGLPD